MHTKRMSAKKQTTVTLDREVMDFLHEQIKTKRFSSISHGVNFAVYKLMREENGLVAEPTK
jgi:Arc/MetJ-type ribon-helix-helix transcriptional regulator